MKRKSTFLRGCLFIQVCLVAALVMTGTPNVYSQETIKVSGTVVDESGAPLLGVSVVVEGTSRGTTVDAKGRYSISVPKKSASLTFSFLGYKKQTIPVNGRTKVDVVMQSDTEVIEDVVVVGYGTMAKRDLTGAVSSLSGSTIAEVPTVNLSSALAGRLAGVYVTTSDGAPDAEVSIRIRGGGSITQDNSPLYIVDGFPMDDLSTLSSSDIQSIDVLKDASSTAIYGARGANGVVIVTTKSAKAGRTTVTYNGYGSFKYVPRMLDMMNSYEYVQMQYELASLKAAAEYEAFIRNYGQPADFDIYKNIPGTDYQDQMFGRTAWGQYHNVAVNGGSDKTKFNLSLSYLNEDGVLRNSSFERANISFKLNHRISQKVKVDLSTYYTNSVTMGAGTSVNSSSEIKNAVNYRPVYGKGNITDDMTEEDQIAYDEIENGSSLYDPITLVDQDYKRRKRTELNVNGALSWNITKNLSLRSEIGGMTRQEDVRRFYGPLTYKARQAGSKPVAERTDIDRPRWRTAHTLTYKYKTKRHSLNAMAGFEAMSEDDSRLEVTARSLPVDITPSDAFARMSFGSQEYPETTVASPTRLASFFGRVNYTYRDKYLFSATFRADGSTKFAPGNQWGYFPSGAFAWRMSEEPFLKDVSWLDNLKLRVSYGEAGNNRIDNDMWRRTFRGAFDTNSMYAGITNIPNLYYANTSTTLVNPNLKWETTVTRNIGVDFGVLKNRIKGTVEAYWNTTRDLLIKSKLPSYKGYTDQLRNIGQTSNRGIEISLEGVIVQKRDFNLNASFNIAFNRNRVDKLDGAESKFYQSGWLGADLRESQDYLLQVGQSIGLMYGYVTDGFYTVDDFMEGEGNWALKPGVANSQPITGSLGAPSVTQGPRVGSLKLKKLTPYDPNDPQSCMVTADDRTVIGNATPKHTGGFTLSGNYKGIDFSVFLNWVYGNDVYNAQKLMNASTWKYSYYNLSNEFNTGNRFMIFDRDGNDLRNDKAALKAYNANATMWSPTQSRVVLHSWGIEDGSFLRLANVTLGYTLPSKLTRKFGVSKLRLYVTGNNLWVWTKYTGFDPEVNTRRSTPLTPGVDYSAYPKARTFTFGANITF